MTAIHTSTSSTESRLREEIAEIGRSFRNLGMAPGTSGNISAKLDDGWLMTPTNASLGALDPAEISKLDWDGNLLAGKPPNLALSSMTPPHHTALRKVLWPHFSPSRTRALEPFARKHAARFLDEGIERGSIDANGGLGRRLSVRVAFAIIGLPEADADRAAELVGLAFDRSPDVKGPNQKALDAQAELHRYLKGQIDSRKAKPGVAAGEAPDDVLAYAAARRAAAGGAGRPRALV